LCQIENIVNVVDQLVNIVTLEFQLRKKIAEYCTNYEQFSVEKSTDRIRINERTVQKLDSNFRSMAILREQHMSVSNLFFLR
jgi:hypothetical protein